MGKNKNQIPDGWVDYQSIGKQIPGTRFIAFKVPLKESFLKNKTLSAENLFYTKSVIENIPNLGMVIDLTSTDRYYDPDDFRKHNIIHRKLMTQGHIIPTEKVFREFCFMVEEFLRTENSGKLIGVHCTHGLNRTGYLICRYMIQRLGNPPAKVITDFNISRGHKMDRKNYLQNLKEASWPEFKELENEPRVSDYNLICNKLQQI